MAAQTLLSKLLIWRLRHLSTKNFVLLLSALIGIISGLAAVFLKWAVHAIQHFLTQDFNAAYANFFYIIYPLIGISLAYWVGNYILRDVGGHGIPDVLYAISKQNSLIPRIKMFSRVLTSALTVGFGGSVGLEAPIVMTGSAIGSNVGLTMHLNAKKRTLLIGCGAAGAISAIFGAPIGAVIFAIEVILLEVSAGSFIPLLLASVMGSITAMLLADSGSILEINLQDDFLAAHMPYYLLLGVFTGLISLYFSRTVLRTEKLMGLLEEPAVKLLYGGAFIGLIIFFFPPIYGEGYETLNALIANDPERILQNSPFLSEVDKPLFIVLFLGLVLLVKPIASAITIGAGGSGGIFAPSLFAGAIAGFLFSYVLNYLGWLPVSLPVAHFTLVAMCGLMSGVQHAPLSAIFLIAELTGGYALFLPLMLVSAISFLTTTYFDKASLYKQQLQDTGRYIPESTDEELLDQIDLRKITEKDLLPTHPEASLAELCELVKKSKRNIFPVLNSDGALVGIVTLDDIRTIMFDPVKQGQLQVKSLMHSPPDFIFLGENMQVVMDKFERSGAWNLPVIADEKYLGFISKSRIFNAYRKRLIKQNQE